MLNKVEEISLTEFKERAGVKVETGETAGSEIPEIGMTWAELREKKFPFNEKVIFGLARGQIGMIVASTNVGKTTFIENLSLCLTSGYNFPPFTDTQNGNPLRVMIIDGENVQSELQRDLNTMMRDWSPIYKNQVDENLFLVCDEIIDDEPLDLKNHLHLSAVIEHAKKFKPDVIVIDTVAALFNLHNENDNAEVKRHVIAPLKMLGKEANAAIILCHHIGKQSEDISTVNSAYSGRGGSNFGALSRTVIKLTRADRLDKTRVILSVAKSKGYHQDDLMMVLDTETRWFSISDEPVPQIVSSYDEIVKAVTKEMSTGEIVDHFKGKFSKRTIETRLKEAFENGEIQRLRQGRYAPVESAEPATPITGSGNCGNDDGALPSPTVGSESYEARELIAALSF